MSDGTLIGAGILVIRDRLIWCALRVSYDLHITRALSWLDAERYPIGREEWNDYARRHSAMVEDGWVEWADIGREPAYSWPRGRSEPSCLSWSGGEVVVTGPVDGYIEDLVAIAEALGANLLGDDGQRYTRGDVVD